MSLSLMMRGNWDGLSMASPQLQSYKPERPVYSTPHPVQSTPANNECKLVEVRGAEVASFIIAGEEYICLPQAFDLFLKHLVGGLHTVYTKLKRLNITPVVCNVEQVRVLRGLGAIQPGVNRCKLITRKDFDTLYQDCTTASRPGRPPKRYPILPPSDLMSHPGARSMNPPRGLLGSPDFANFHKRMRLDHDAGYHQQQARRMSSSPTRSSPPTARKYSSGADELYANAANIYLQQALRQQYQQFIANGLHNGMSSQHAPMNAALAPLIGMSNPNLFNGSIPPNLLNHINEYARNNAREGINANLNREGGGGANSSPRQENTEGAEKQLESPRARYNSLSYENAERENKTVSQVDRSTRSPQNGLDGRKSSDHPPCTTPNSLNGRRSVGNGSVSSFDSGNKSLGEQDYNRTPRSPNDREDFTPTHMSHNSKYEEPKDNQIKVESLESDAHGDDWRAPPGPSNISSMQTLLSNIQGLLKVAADNAKLQDKQLSFEIADLKNRICKEQELRGLAERKLEESERIRASIQRKLKREREAVKRLQEQKLSAHEKLPEATKEKPCDDVDVTSSPSEAGSPASNCDVHSSHNLQVDTNAVEHGSTTPTPTSDFSPSASSPSSVNDCAPYWSGRSLASDINSHRNQSPERTSPVNMTSGERNWMACNLVQSSSCAK